MLAGLFSTILSISIVSSGLTRSTIINAGQNPDRQAADPGRAAYFLAVTVMVTVLLALWPLALVTFRVAV